MIGIPGTVYLINPHETSPSVRFFFGGAILVKEWSRVDRQIVLPPKSGLSVHAGDAYRFHQEMTDVKIMPIGNHFKQWGGPWVSRSSSPVRYARTLPPDLLTSANSMNPIAEVNTKK